MSDRRRITGFVDERAFEWRELVEPDGPPSGRQLRRLNSLGRLELVEPGAAVPLTKAEAAAALDDVGDEPTGRDNRDRYIAGEQPAEERRDRI